MKKNMNGLQALLVLLLISQMSYGQVYYGIDLSEDEQTYTISLKSGVDIPSPLNMTGTAQVTIKFPTNSNVQINNLVPLQPLTAWNKTVRINQPTEAMDYDYVTFGLGSLGTTGFTFEQDSIVALFSFQNTGVSCAGLVEIIDNQTDIFAGLNSEDLSVQNQISILGMGGDAYAGNYKGSVNCETAVSTQPIIDEQSNLSVYPNPAVNYINVDYTISTNTATQLIIFDALGRQLITQDLNGNQANLQLDIENLVAGAYYIHIKNENYLSKTKTFVKLSTQP